MRSRFHLSIHLWSPALIFLGVIAAAASATAQDEIASDRAFLEKLSGVVMETSARVEKSIVAITRVPHDEALPALGAERQSASLELMLQGTSATNPDYIPRAFGSGVVVDKSGLILTTLHVLGEVSQNDYVVWLQRRPYKAKVKAADAWLDVAVLQIAADDLTPISLGDASLLKKGQLAIALGNPLGIARDGVSSVRWTSIANLARSAPPNLQSRARRGRDTLHHYGTLIQLDDRQTIGCSGGALVNLQGELVGLITTFVSLPGQTSEAGYAIPIDDDFKRALDTLKQGRLPEYGFLGIAPQSLSLAARQSGQRGAVVEDVVPGTPAAQAGVKQGDTVTQVNGVDVRDDMHLIRLVSAQLAESQVKLQLKRERVKTPQTVTVVLSKKYQESRRESFAEVTAPFWRGMQVEFATAAPAFRESSRHIDPEGCVAVLEVARNSPAWNAGLRGGQFISHVGAKRVATPRAFHAVVAGEVGAATVRVTTSPDGVLVRRVSAM